MFITNFVYAKLFLVCLMSWESREIRLIVVLIGVPSFFNFLTAHGDSFVHEKWRKWFRACHESHKAILLAKSCGSVDSGEMIK